MHNYQLGMNECLRVFLARRRVSFARRRASTFIARSKSSMTLVNSLSISSTLCGWASPLNVLSTIVSICQFQKCRLPTETPMFDIVTRAHCNVLHHFEHSQDCLLQDFRFFFFFGLCMECCDPVATSFGRGLGETRPGGCPTTDE